MLDVATIDDVAVPPADAAPAAPPAPAVTPVRWSLAARIAFRLGFTYFGLYVIATQMLNGLLMFPFDFGIPNLGSLATSRAVVSWVATHVFRVRYQFVNVQTGSGDRTMDWVQAACLLALAIAVTAVWSIVDRRRASYVSLHKWFRLFLRFALGATMLTYGAVKMVPLQMPAPPLDRLLEPFGNFSPMGVLWYSIGASRSYEIFAGSMEVTAAVLLFVPRLATLGALVCFATAVQIFTLNMTYDVPVKLFAFHLILMSLFLIAPEASRLLDVLVLDRAAGPSAQPPLLTRRRGRRILLAAQLVFAAYLVFINFKGAREAWFARGGGGPTSPLYGVWNVDEMAIDGVTRAPLVTDYGRYRRLTFQSPTAMSFWRMDDTFTRYTSAIDMNAKTLTLTRGNDQAWKAPFSLQQPSPDRLILDGTMDGHAVHLRLRLIDRKTFLLVSRGFHWIQEAPFNR